MRNETEAGRAVEQYADTVRRVCFMHLKNYHDVEDVFQDVFLKYVLYEGNFASDDHEKAWLIRVAINACKDVQKSFFRRRVSSLEAVTDAPFYIQAENLVSQENPENLKNLENREILAALWTLPVKYRDVLYLFYYEGYTAVEIAGILKKNENTIYTWLARARAKLKDALGGEYIEG